MGVREQGFKEGQVVRGEGVVLNVGEGHGPLDRFCACGGRVGAVGEMAEVVNGGTERGECETGGLDGGREGEGVRCS
ncbi:hypothetical protein Stsp02_32150 [Streptomyces sp. NBRC 14336]|nr:hypothetical protein Stsp02_32150 [Streptomyces sp. NBRC 14336]